MAIKNLYNGVDKSKGIVLSFFYHGNTPRASAEMLCPGLSNGWTTPNDLSVSSEVIFNYGRAGNLNAVMGKAGVSSAANWVYYNKNIISFTVEDNSLRWNQGTFTFEDFDANMKSHIAALENFLIQYVYNSNNEQ